MKQEDVISSIRQRYLNINSFSEILFEGFDEESVQLFRQEVERLKALFFLIGDKEGSGIPVKLLAFYRKTGVIHDLQRLRWELIAYAKQKKVGVPESCLAVVDGLLSMASRLVSMDLAFRPLCLREPGSWPALHHADLSKLSKAFVRDRMKAMSVEVSVEELSDAQLCDTEEAMRELLHIWHLLDKRAVGLLRPVAMTERQAIQSQLSLLTNYRDVVLRINMLQDPNFLFATGQGAKPFLQAVLQEWIREKQRLRAAINASPVSGEERPVVRRRRAKPVIRSLTACDFS